MPRCLLHAVRDYKSGKYAGGMSYDPFVMTTRSGLSINTVPRGSKFTSLRRISPFGSNIDEEKLSVKKKSPQSIPPSLHCLSFVTRFYIGRRLPSLDLAGIASKEFVHWREELLSLWESKRADSEESRASTSTQCLQYGENVRCNALENLWKEASSSHTDSCSSLQNTQYQLSHFSPTRTIKPDLTGVSLAKQNHIEYQHLLPSRYVVEADSLPNSIASTFVTPSVLRSVSVASSPRYHTTGGSTLLCNAGKTSRLDIDMFESGRGKAETLKREEESESEGSIDDADQKFTECDAEFRGKSSYKQLVWTNRASRNACNICGKIFSRSWLLKGHVRTHTGERPFQCTFPSCEKAFADKSNLRSHLLIHNTARKTYSCPKCGRSFAQKRYLHKHMLEVCRML